MFETNIRKHPVFGSSRGVCDICGMHSGLREVEGRNGVRIVPVLGPSWGTLREAKQWVQGHMLSKHRMNSRYAAELAAAETAAA